MRATAAALRAAAAAAAVALGACATQQLERSALPFASPVIEVAPGSPYERCIDLVAGDRLYFAYRADPPMSFALRRPSRTAVISYMLRDASREETGLFPVAETSRYCLHWEPEKADAPWPTLLRYEMRLTGAP